MVEWTMGTSTRPRGGFCCLPLLKSRTEGGRRQESEGRSLEQSRRKVFGAVAGFLPSPLLRGSSGNGKIVRREQPGEPTHWITEQLAAWARATVHEPA
jgi:hypothetical protein